jgi:hypothetical protein
LRLVAEPGGQYGQQRPAERKRQQHHTGEHILSCRDERHDHQNHGGNQSSRHGQSNDQPDPAIHRRLQASGLFDVLSRVPGDHDRPILIKD